MPSGTESPTLQTMSETTNGGRIALLEQRGYDRDREEFRTLRAHLLQQQPNSKSP